MTTETAPASEPTVERAEVGVDASMTLTHLPSRDETIRTNALSLAISAKPLLLDREPLDGILHTAARFEAYIRDGAA